MSETVKRGSSPGDGRDFSHPALEIMKRSAEELAFLLDRGYAVKGASTFIGNHYLLSERQRIALTRIVSSEKDISARIGKKKCPEDLPDETVNIDGFNEIITLEVALSGSPILLCMGGTYRDLAGLRGTYRLIDKTDTAIRLIILTLKRFSVKNAIFWLDAPVSNSGRLKTRIAEITAEEKLETGIEIVANVDRVLYGLTNVISSDGIILDKCHGWFNLSEEIIPGIPDVQIIDLSLRTDAL